MPLWDNLNNVCTYHSWNGHSKQIESYQKQSPHSTKHDRITAVHCQQMSPAQVCAISGKPSTCWPLRRLIEQHLRQEKGNNAHTCHKLWCSHAFENVQGASRIIQVLSRVSPITPIVGRCPLGPYYSSSSSIWSKFHKRKKQQPRTRTHAHRAHSHNHVNFMICWHL